MSSLIPGSLSKVMTRFWDSGPAPFIMFMGEYYREHISWLSVQFVLGNNNISVVSLLLHCVCLRK